MQWTVGATLPDYWSVEISTDGGATWFEDNQVMPPFNAVDESAYTGNLARVTGRNADGSQWSAISNVVTVA